MSLAVGAEGTGWFVQGDIGQGKLQTGEGTERDPGGGPLGMVTFTRFPVEYDDGTVFGIASGYSFDLGRVELEVKQLDNKIMEPAASTLGSNEIQAQAAFGNVWYAFGKDWWIQPYVGGGLGYVQQKLTGADNWGSVAQVGLGADWPFAERWILTLGYRFFDAEAMEFKRGDRDLSSTYRGQRLSLGIRYNFFGPAKAPEPESVKVVALVPLCKDGVDNDSDALVDFPKDPGCESADDQDETDPPQCRDGKDNDGDGLIDHPDDKGCTDGEDNDEKDPCKTPEIGERVDLRGCGTGDVITLKGVHFEFDRAALTVDSRRVLDEVAEELLAYPRLIIEIGGHTDAKGSDAYNQSLSERRASSVRSYLIDKGVPEGRLTAVGYGEAKPVAGNQTDEGRALNRRVELKILSVEEAPAPTAPEAGANK